MLKFFLLCFSRCAARITRPTPSSKSFSSACEMKWLKWPAASCLPPCCSTAAGWALNTSWYLLPFQSRSLVCVQCVCVRMCMCERCFYVVYAYCTWVCHDFNHWACAWSYFTVLLTRWCSNLYVLLILIMCGHQPPGYRINYWVGSGPVNDEHPNPDQPGPCLHLHLFH